MIEVSKKSDCNGCHACASACPKQCIVMVQDEDGFFYPHVDMKRCCNCKKCIESCPVTNQVNILCGEENERTVYASYTIKEQVRKKSSSGGIFTEIALSILREDGVVYGAAFEKNFQVHHIAIESEEELSQLQGSKYVQSTIGNAYIEARKHLEEGRKVLFTGTPCQIGGLHCFLKKDYSNLITQDIICHGVPSPRVWKSYLDYRVKRAGAGVKSVSFRKKNYGWKMYSVQIDFENDAVYKCKFCDDPYMKGFLTDLYLRPSCYACVFKGIERKSDITLADFWGIQNVLPEMDDDKGTSLVFINSEKGHILFDAIKETVERKEVTIDNAISGNPAMVSSAKEPINRDEFLTQTRELGFEKAARRNNLQRSKGYIFLRCMKRFVWRCVLKK